MNISECLLIETDGYSIETEKYATLEAAQEAMRKRYEEETPGDGLNESESEMSYLGTYNAILYANGENVFVWKIYMM